MGLPDGTLVDPAQRDKMNTIPIYSPCTRMHAYMLVWTMDCETVETRQTKKKSSPRPQPPPVPCPPSPSARSNHAPFRLAGRSRSTFHRRPRSASYCSARHFGGGRSNIRTDCLHALCLSTRKKRGISSRRIASVWLKPSSAFARNKSNPTEVTPVIPSNSPGINPRVIMYRYTNSVPVSHDKITMTTAARSSTVKTFHVQRVASPWMTSRVIQGCSAYQNTLCQQSDRSTNYGDEVSFVA